MEYRRLGRSGLQVSALSFGAWVTFGKQVDDGVAEGCLRAAYAGGVNFFDNAEVYAAGRAETVMGALLEKLGWPRDSFLVSSKVFWGAERNGPNQCGLSRKHVLEACHAALRRLRVDYLDLYFCHRPDPATPIEETVRAMNTLIEQGKVLYWGTSEWSAAEIQEAMDIADALGLIAPTMEQPQYNLLHRARLEREYAPLFAGRHGLGTTVWSPLASGLLTGKYNDGIPADTRLNLAGMEWLRDRFTGDPQAWAATIARIRALADLAAEAGMPLHHLALAWCLKNPNVSSVILGASRVAQVTDNLRALAAVPSLTDDLMAKIDAICPMTND
jgi:voltage-dependent potassium channel beta subunit